LPTSPSPPAGGARAAGHAAAPRARAGDHLIAGIPTVWLAIFFLAPLAFTLVVSFGRSTFGEVELAFTLDNYRTALSGFYASVFLRTIEFAVTACVLCLLVAFPTAYFIARHAGRFRTLALVVVLIPYFTSFLIRIMSWQILLARGGPLETVLHALGIYSGHIDILDTKTAVFIGMVYAYLPIAIVPLYVVLVRLPDAVVEASLDLGATRWQTFRHVTLPLARPGIATAVLLTAVPMLGELVIPSLLGGDRGVLVGQAISSQYLDAQNYALGSAMAMIVLVVIALMVAILARFTRGFDEVPA
jgi:ABC-type spermidine/putrescine transport system permease subunit I